MPTVYHLIKGDESVKAPETIVKTKWHGLDLIPSHVDLAGAEVELVDEIGRENKLKDALDDLNNAYDFILLDTPPSLSLLTVNVLAYAKEVLVPCQTHPYAYAALEELFDTILTIKKNINQDLSITGVVATLFDTRTRVSHRILEKLKNDDRYGPLLFETVIRVNTTIAESAGVGKPVVFYRQNSYGSLDYADLATAWIARRAVSMSSGVFLQPGESRTVPCGKVRRWRCAAGAHWSPGRQRILCCSSSRAATSSGRSRSEVNEAHSAVPSMGDWMWTPGTVQSPSSSI